jgi:hypothetical protein
LGAHRKTVVLARLLWLERETDIDDGTCNDEKVELIGECVKVAERISPQFNVALSNEYHIEKVVRNVKHLHPQQRRILEVNAHLDYVKCDSAHDEHFEFIVGGDSPILKTLGILLFVRLIH